MDRNLFVTRLWAAKRLRRVSATGYLIGRAMLRRSSKQGRLWPSQQTLANDVGCERKTVGREVVKLCDAGLLSSERRPRKRWNRHDTNLYVLRVPASIEPRAPKPQESKEESIFESSCDQMSHGSLTPQERAAIDNFRQMLGLVEPLPCPHP